MTKRLVSNHGHPRWRVDFGKKLINGKWKRHVKFFTDEVAADKAIRAAEKDQSTVGKKWLDLPAEVRAKTVDLLDEMEASGYTIAQVWDAFRIERLTPVDETKRRSFTKAIPEFVEMLKRTNKRQAYIDSCEAYLSQFARGREE